MDGIHIHTAYEEYHVPLRQLITWINIIKNIFLLLDQTAPHQKWEAAVLEDQAGTAVTSATAEHPNLFLLEEQKILMEEDFLSSKLSVSYPLVNVRSKGTSWLFLN
ncbi:hypothetical protein ACJX0J_025833 [Zea mays]